MAGLSLPPNIDIEHSDGLFLLRLVRRLPARLVRTGRPAREGRHRTTLNIWRHGFAGGDLAEFMAASRKLRFIKQSDQILDFLFRQFFLDRGAHHGHQFRHRLFDQVDGCWRKVNRLAAAVGFRGGAGDQSSGFKLLQHFGQPA